MKLLMIAFGLSMVMSGCANRTKLGQESVTDTASSHLALIKATGQQWTAGIKGGGSGTEYTFVLAVLTTETLRFNEVILGGQPYTPVVLKQGRTVSQVQTEPQLGDTLNLRISGSRELVTPTVGTSAATIHYTLGGEAQVLEVPAITILAPQQRP